MKTMANLVQAGRYQTGPLRVLKSFLREQKKLTEAGVVDQLRFVGYALELGYDTATIITSDPYKKAVGGIPRGSFLILALEEEEAEDLPPHFTLLRVMDTAPTPLSSQVQQTYFELHKKSMPELDVWTQSELQWGALKCSVLGMFYPNPSDDARVQFSGDVNTVVSAHRYSVYAPDAALLALIVNGAVRTGIKRPIGHLRLTECTLSEMISKAAVVMPKVEISLDDFKGARTAMFGKTRLGKSNVVKILADAVIRATSITKNVGQLIFDINGEYANDNPQDGNTSIRGIHPGRCTVYALTKRQNTPSEDLSLNFYEAPNVCMPVLAELIEADGQTSNYITRFASVSLPSVSDVEKAAYGDKTRMARKIMFYWAILMEAGFRFDEKRLASLGVKITGGSNFDPGFNKEVRAAMHGEGEHSKPQTMNDMLAELKKVATLFQTKSKEAVFNPPKSNPVFDSEDQALMGFLAPSASSSGASILAKYKIYHKETAGAFERDIIKKLDSGETVILDLGNAQDRVRRYFSDLLSRKIFEHQENKFVSNALGDKFIQLYFEEAHNLFPANDKDITGVYARFAKEGAKFHIGMVYSTQSPSTISKELLAQTDNFFVGHLSSQDETKALARVQVKFAGMEDDIMRSKTPGYMRMLTQSHRFVIPVQVEKFEALSPQTGV